MNQAASKEVVSSRVANESKGCQKSLDWLKDRDEPEATEPSQATKNQSKEVSNK